MKTRLITFRSSFFCSPCVLCPILCPLLSTLLSLGGFLFPRFFSPAALPVCVSSLTSYSSLLFLVLIPVDLEFLGTCHYQQLYARKTSFFSLTDLPLRLSTFFFTFPSQLGPRDP